MNVRRLALEAINDIIDKEAFSNIVVNDFLKKYELSDADKGLFTNLVYGTMQNLITIEYYLEPFIKGKKVKSAEFIVDAELKTEYTDSSDYFAELLRTQFSNFQELYGVDLEVKQTKTGAKLIMKMNKESFNNIYGSSSQNIDKDNIKRNFEDNGYACK